MLLGLAVPTHAAPITVSAGESVTFNFDFLASSLVPAPPYTFVSFYTGLDSLGAQQSGSFGLWKGYSELDGGGTEIFAYGTALLAVLLGDGAVDGVFSMVLSGVTGSITVDPFAHVYIDNNTLGPGPVVPTIPGAVPEPATLTLLGAGLGAAAWRRRRTTV
jgi:hypothetical protein